MKTFRAWLAIGAVLTPALLLTEAIAQTCTAPPTDLVSWWPADGDATDIQDANSGVLQGGAAFAAGNVGQAFSLDGIDGTVHVPDNANLHPGLGSFTVEAWVMQTRAHSTDAIAPVVSKLNGDFRDGYTLATGINTSTDVWAGVSDIFQNQVFVAGPSMPFNQWVHLAMTYDGSTKTLNLYKDGVLGGTASNPLLGEVSSAGSIFRIGSYLRWYGAAQTFPGLIDEVSYYSRVLAPTEILSIFNAGSAGKCKPIAEQPNLLVDKSDSSDPVLAGDQFVYTIGLSNIGTAAATEVTLTDSLPAQVTFVSANTTQGSCTAVSGDTVVCELGTIAAEPSAAASVTITVRTTVPGAIVNFAEAAAAETDADESDNSDTEETTVISVTCAGRSPTIVGTAGNDVITGTKGADVIHGLGGNDVVSGGNGNDIICGGNGGDTLNGGNDADQLFGEEGDDRLNGDNGDDAMNGGLGTDPCNGGKGTDSATSCEAVTSVP